MKELSFVETKLLLPLLYIQKKPTITLLLDLKIGHQRLSWSLLQANPPGVLKVNENCAKFEHSCLYLTVKVSQGTEYREENHL